MEHWDKAGTWEEDETFTELIPFFYFCLFVSPLISSNNLALFTQTLPWGRQLSICSCYVTPIIFTCYMDGETLFSSKYIVGEKLISIKIQWYSIICEDVVLSVESDQTTPTQSWRKRLSEGVVLESWQWKGDREQVEREREREMNDLSANQDLCSSVACNDSATGELHYLSF